MCQAASTRRGRRYAAKLITEVEQGLYRHDGRHAVANPDRWIEHIEGLGRSISDADGLVGVEGTKTHAIRA